MTQMMRAISALGFLCLLALGFAGHTAAAEAGGVSKAVYSSSDNALMQLVSRKPCCYNPYNGGYARSTPSTCRKYGGYIVQDGYCGGYGYHPYPVRPHPGQPYPIHPNPNWGGGQPGGYAVCCKRKRRDWWSPNAYTCQQQGGYVTNAWQCRNG